MGYTYIMSDIHGRKNRFDSVLQQIDLKPEDELYILGDVIDRGEYGIELLKQIIKMSNAHMLIGNHEFMMLNAIGEPYDGIKRNPINSRILWYRNGGEVTHSAWKAQDSNTKEEILSYLKSLPFSIDLELNKTKYRLIHAAPPEFYYIFENMHNSMAEYCVWERKAIDFMKDSSSYYIFGHTPTFYFSDKLTPCIWFENNLIGIDCGCALEDKVMVDNGVLTGRLGCLRLDDMKTFYSEE